MNINTPNIKYFENIPAVPKRNMILTRLGYHHHTTVLDHEHKIFLEKGIQKGLLLCHSKGAFGRFRIINRTPEYVSLENGDNLVSAKLSKLLENSNEVVLMSSTVGSDIVKNISLEIEEGNASLGIILDAVASETADSGLDWMMDFINKLLVREGKHLTKYRYSPGYGDLPLSNQKIIYDALHLDRLNLKLTEKYMLIPEKSVLAIAGIERIEIDG